MKEYYIDEFESFESYKAFIRYMIAHSDTFSLVYFKYVENERVKSSVKEVKKLLAPYKIFSFKGNQWPSMVTLNENNHIYDITLYRADIGVETALVKEGKLFDWDYPRLPMDLCFYKNSYAWFVSCAHEKYACIYIDDNEELSELNLICSNLTYNRDVAPSWLFREENLKVLIKTKEEFRNWGNQINQGTVL